MEGSIFTGERWEAYTELLFLRARYYEPGTGRFISKDPWGGEVGRPLTLNPYLYGVGDPVNSLDYLGTNPHRGSIYSCNCGFIDNAHFDQAEDSFAAAVIRKVKQADTVPEFDLSLPNAFWKIVQRTESRVRIKQHLNDREQGEVALGIFEAMENKSETGFLQVMADSDWDEEDLISNLLSFYFSLGGEYTLENISKWCGYLDEVESGEVFDWYKAHLGFKKVKEWGKPRLARCADAKCGILWWRSPCEDCPLDRYCPGERRFPSDKFSIVPEPEGDKWEFVEGPSVRPSIE